MPCCDERRSGLRGETQITFYRLPDCHCLDYRLPGLSIARIIKESPEHLYPGNIAFVLLELDARILFVGVV